MSLHTITTMLSRLAGVALAGFLLVSLPGVATEAHGASASQCAGFSRSVATLHQNNRRYRCGLRGADWGNLRALRAWCLRTHYVSVTRRLARMRRQVDGCRRCRPYAKRSFQQQLVNVGKRCGLRGADWSADQRVHYRWCMSRSKQQTDTKIRQRSAALRACSNKRKLRLCYKQRRDFSTMKLLARRYRCLNLHSRWYIQPRAFYQRCVRSEFGLSIFKAYKADMKRCKRCKDYALKMVKMSRDTHKYRCSLRLGTSYPAHMRICLREPLHRSHNRLISVGRRTNGCICRHYAKSAVAAIQSNRLRRCGLERRNYGSFGSGRDVWSGNYSWHHRWCRVALTRYPQKVMRAMQLRQTMLLSCRRKRR